MLETVIQKHFFAVLDKGKLLFKFKCFYFMILSLAMVVTGRVIYLVLVLDVPFGKSTL